MSSESIRIKDIVNITGLDKGNLSSWINGTREMRRPIQSMFYFMLGGQIK